MSVTFYIPGVEIPSEIAHLFPTHEQEMADMEAAHKQWEEYEKAYSAWEQKHGPVEVNLANGNAAELLRYLDQDTEELCGSLDPWMILVKLTDADPAELARETVVEESVIIDEEGVAAGPKIIHCGADEKYWDYRWRQIIILAGKAIKVGEKIHYA